MIASWPHGQDRWHAFAAALNARMALLQLHVQPDWLYALCTSCGWELECTRPEMSRFRQEAAVHRCIEISSTKVEEFVQTTDQLLF